MAIEYEMRDGALVWMRAFPDLRDRQKI